MKVVVIDGQGGKIGRALVKSIRERFPEAELTAVGANSAATAEMLKGGAPRAVTGENPVIVACRTADVIMGPIGIVIADALLGEITPAMAAAVGQAHAVRILIPLNRCENIVAGVGDQPVNALLESALEELGRVLSGG